MCMPTYMYLNPSSARTRAHLRHYLDSTTLVVQLSCAAADKNAIDDGMVWSRTLVPIISTRTSDECGEAAQPSQSRTGIQTRGTWIKGQDRARNASFQVPLTWDSLKVWETEELRTAP